MTPRYQAQFAKVLVNQLIAILQRDQQAALDLVNAARPAGRTLKPFAAFHKEAAPIQNWPALVLVGQQVSFNNDSDADLRTHSAQFFCAMSLTGMPFRTSRSFKAAAKMTGKAASSSCMPCQKGAPPSHWFCSQCPFSCCVAIK